MPQPVGCPVEGRWPATPPALARVGEQLVRVWRNASGWNGPADVQCGSDRILMPNEDKVLLPGSQSR